MILFLSAARPKVGRLCFLLNQIKHCWKHLCVEHIAANLLQTKDKFRTANYENTSRILKKQRNWEFFKDHISIFWNDIGIGLGETRGFLIRGLNNLLLSAYE